MLCKEEESIRFEPIKIDGLARNIVSEIQFAASVSTKYLKRKIYPVIKSRLKELHKPILAHLRALFIACWLIFQN